jgi:hypothetical protein
MPAAEVVPEIELEIPRESPPAIEQFEPAIAPALHAVPAIGPTSVSAPAAPAMPTAETSDHVVSGGDTRGRTAGAMGRSATVTDFPVHATRPPTPTVAALVPTPVTLVDLLEKQGGLEWRRAVAVIHQICGLLKQQPPHQPILLEPRNILITHEGQVRLLPGLSGGDPLVIQLGRLLRTMLTGNDAPPELRLLLAQATFELPIFESVEDVDRALVQLERFEGTSGDGHGFMSPIAPPRPAESAPPPNRPASSGRSILPQPHAGRRGAHNKPSFLGMLYAYGLHVAAVAIVVAAIAALMTTRPGLLWPGGTAALQQPPPTTAALAAPIPSPTSVDSPLEPTTSQPVPTPPVARAANPLARPPLVPTPTARVSPGDARTVDRRAPEVGRAVEAPIVKSAPARAAATPPGSGVSSRDSERRAAALIAQGQTAEAGIVFDALLLSNPLYEPDPTSLTPEALDAFRASQRNLLPNIAQKNFDRARAALAAGDPDRALTLGKEVAAILDRRLAEPPAQMRAQVDDLIEAASTAKTTLDDIVYTTNDKGVVPPRELSRQFPATTPLGVPPHRVGTLEMIIDKEGGVEFVKLHTPLNRYHERMIVSAAKAWRYRPATRNGKPVKYRLTVRINLPESGTDF